MMIASVLGPAHLLLLWRPLLDLLKWLERVGVRGCTWLQLNLLEVYGHPWTFDRRRALLKWWDSWVAYCQLSDFLMGKDRLVTQRWQLKLVFNWELLWTVLESNCANSASPHFIVLVLAVELEQFLMVFEVSELLPHVDRGRLLVDVESKFHIRLVNALFSWLHLLVLVFLVVGFKSHRVLPFLLRAFGAARRNNGLNLKTIES